jgi:hypothetical protein
MFLETTVEQRILAWRKFRERLETCDNPLQETMDFWFQAPRINRLLDPWDSQRWNTPWELLKENRFCPVAIPLMMGWTLKLTTKFSKANILIKSIIDISSQRYYNLLYVDDNVLNYGSTVEKEYNLQSNLVCQYQTRI